MSEPQNIVREHSYDGIQEYDNPLPGWWNFLFYGSIAFSVLYFLYFQTGVPNRSVIDRYNAAVARNLRLQFAEIGDLEPTRENMVKYMDQPKWLELGAAVFKANCYQCHGAEGQGMVGPNLHDDWWLHVTRLEDIPKVVSEGAKNGAMPPWKHRLHVNEVLLVSCYVAAMRGQPTTAPPKPHEKEAKEIPPWDMTPPPAAPAAAQANSP